jgi:hypothetical protein
LLLLRSHLLLLRSHLLLLRSHLLLLRTHLLLLRSHLLLWRTHLLIWRSHLLLWRTHLLIWHSYLLLLRCLRLATPTHLLYYCSTDPMIISILSKTTTRSATFTPRKISGNTCKLLKFFIYSFV